MCEHEEFECHSAIGRLSREDGGPITLYCADIKVNCRQCGKPFEFVGLPLGFIGISTYCQAWTGLSCTPH